MPDDRLARFDDEHSIDGLLIRYGRGRLKHFLGRQVMTVLGTASLIVLVSPWIGLLTLSLALLGEAVDCLFLRQLEPLRDRGVSFRTLHRGANLTAGFQALTISACVVIALYYTQDVSATFFAFAFLTGGAINVTMIMPYHMMSSYIRLSIYALVGLGYFGWEIVQNESNLHLAFDGLGLAMMAVMVRAFAKNTINHTHRNWRATRELLAGQIEAERAANELDLSQRENYRLSMVARHASDSVVLAGPDRRITWVNDAFIATTGYTLDEARGHTPAELLNGPETDSVIADMFTNEGMAGRALRSEVLNYTKDGRKVWMEVNITPIQAPDGTVEMFVAVERNITAAKTHERHLAEAKAAAEDGARAKAAFLATMSHEIRTPMNGIIGMADLLSDTDLTHDQHIYTNTIRDSAGALLTIINDVLDFSKLEADKLSIEAEPFSLADCVSAAAALMRAQAQGKGLSLDVSHTTRLPARLLGDMGRIRQIIINLLSNAVKFTDAGSITVQVSAHPAPQDVQDQVTDLYDIEIRVTDTGIGVPAGRVEQIFDHFVQADAATTRQFGGTGLGLAISRQLARRMYGDLVLDTRRRGGSSFVLSLRLPEAERMDSPPIDTATQEVTRDLSGTRILLAEDNLTNQMLIKAFLDDIDPGMRIASNGREAVDMTQQARPDIILMDMAMPELDGLAATREIRALDGPQPIIIALTANAFQADRDRCIAAGMDDFLSKPVRKAQLLDVLHTALVARENEL
ncbi:MAG: ATP-binding protein [Paracoccaceae bacterium]